MATNSYYRVIRWIRAKLWILGLLFILTGCKGLFGNSQDTNLLPIKEGVLFTVKEVHDHKPQPSEPFIQLEMKTLDIYRCMNFGLVSELSQTSSSMHINIWGVKETDVCLTALGPAKKSFPLNIAPGKYDLSFTHQSRHFPYELTVTDSSLHVSGDSSFVAPETNVFWRYPENSFAFLCQSNADSRWMCEEFEQMMRDSLEVTPFNFPDYGTKPYPSGSDQYNIAHYYRYPEAGVFQDAGMMLEAYSDSVVSQHEGAFLSVINWKDKGFRSWTDAGE